MPIIEVTISTKGESTVRTKGFAGNDCLQASKFIENALGLTTGEQKTGEFYALAESQHHQINQ